MIFLCAIELHYCLIKDTSMSHTFALGDMFLHYYTHTHTVVYFDSIPHTPSCCQKYSPQPQMWINPLLKIAPDKSTMFSCLSYVWEIKALKVKMLMQNSPFLIL